MSKNRCRLIALTGYGQESDCARSKIAGFDAHLVKPVVISELLKVIAGEGSAEETSS
jgi:CheY-like chemotaxis protein